MNREERDALMRGAVCPICGENVPGGLLGHLSEDEGIPWGNTHWTCDATCFCGRSFAMLEKLYQHILELGLPHIVEHLIAGEHSHARNT